MGHTHTRTCISDNIPATIASVLFPLSFVILVGFASQLRDRFLPFFAFKIERRILCSIVVSHATFCLSVPFLVLPGLHVQENSHVCANLLKTGEIVIYSYFCCTFIGYTLLILNRYLRCEFAFSYRKTVTITRTNIAVVTKWLLAYAINIAASLACTDQPEFTLFVSYRRSMAYTFSAIYFSSVLTIALVNFRLWFMSHKRQRTVDTTERSIEMSTRDNQGVRRRFVIKRHYKTSAILFCLTIKNLVCFLPFVILVLIEQRKAAYFRIVGPVIAVSPLLDPWIYLLMNRSVRGAHL